MPGENDTHIYGGTDAENRQTPTTDGFHGEAKTPVDDEEHPERTRQVMTSDGDRVTVEDVSGIAAAEAAGNTGLNR